MSCKAKITSEQTVSIKLIINIIYSEKTHTHIFIYEKQLGFPGGSSGKESACSAGDLGSISGLGRSPGEGNSYSLQYSWLENSMDRGAWQAADHGVAKSQAQLSKLLFHSTV